MNSANIQPNPNNRNTQGLRRWSVADYIPTPERGNDKTLPEFDMANLLVSDEAISEYLSQVLDDGDNDELLWALGSIAKAKGMGMIAKEAGLGRESLYKALSPGSKPRFDTVLKVLKALGVRLHAKPI